MQPHPLRTRKLDFLIVISKELQKGKVSEKDLLALLKKMYPGNKSLFKYKYCISNTDILTFIGLFSSVFLKQILQKKLHEIIVLVFL